MRILTRFILALAVVLSLMGTATNAFAQDEVDRFRVKVYYYRDVAALDWNTETGWVVVEYFDNNGQIHKDRLKKAERRASGVNGTIPFASGEFVYGDTIQLKDGTVFRSCIIATWQDGFVFNGVVNPSLAESRNAIYCGQPLQQAQPAAPSRGRIETGNDPNGRQFFTGERVTGAFIRLADGSTHEQCTYAQAPQNGTVYGGVINGRPDEQPTRPC